MSAQPAVNWLLTFASELQIAVADPRVWLAIVVAVVLGAVSLAAGTWIAIRVGILRVGAPDGERLGVGLSVGLVTLASGWAAVGSMGLSSFTPVALTLAASLALAFQRRGLDPGRPEDTSGPTRRRTWLSAATGVAAVLFVALIGLIYGATISPSPRDGTQPIEFFDMAYYAVLGSDLAETGREWIYGPSGFDTIPGVTQQSWYHWGELWLTAAVLNVADVGPMFARHYVVLPLLLLAAAALTGTLVRILGGASSRAPFLLGASATLFLGTLPLAIPGSHFGSFARGLLYGIVTYGLGAVVVLLAVYLIVTASIRRSLAASTFSAGVVASLLPAHVALALLGAVGVAAVSAGYALAALARTGRTRRPMPGSTRFLVTTSLVIVATIAWGTATGHGLAATAPSNTVEAFNGEWLEAVVLTAATGGIFWTIPLAVWMCRRDAPMTAAVLLATSALTVAGAVMWGAGAADFNTFHLFFGAIAAFATPAAAVATWIVWNRFRASGRRVVAAAVLITCLVQVEFGAGATVARLITLGPHQYAPIPTAMLDSIGALPPRAKLAYACQPFEEFAFWDAHLVSINAHTGRRVVPLCFMPDLLFMFFEGKRRDEISSAFYSIAPQRELFPTANASPSATAVTAFLRRHDIDYIYADSFHPNTLVAGASLVVAHGEWRLYRVP
jgi:hypothetical protein